MASWASVPFFLDPVAPLLVVGGSLAIAALRAGRGERAAAFAALKPLFTADPGADARAARLAVSRIEAIAEARDISCADRVETAQRFLRNAARRLSDSRSADEFARWAADELDDREARHGGAVAFWCAVADTAPAMGLVGTIIGLTAMFARMDDPARLGPAMALALLATLWGVIVANAVAGPIAARLERLSKAELAWQRAAIDRLAALARAELPHVHPRHNHLRPVA